MKKKKLKLAANIDGPGWNFVGWQHPDIPADSSENIDFYIETSIYKMVFFENLII